MEQDNLKINVNYENFYASRMGSNVYPTEFIVRSFLASYPNLKFSAPTRGQSVLDMAFGDCRNTVFLCEQGYNVSGIEITQGIVDQAKQRLANLGHRAELRVGRNSSIPFSSNTFDCLLACHCCYYCDEGETFAENMTEYVRVMKPGASLVASLASRESYIFDNALPLEDGSLRIQGDPYANRNGYRLQAFSNENQIRSCLSTWFENFSFGFADNNFYGINERVFWVVCNKKGI
jgi:ubiquinone/menaquinone biosynthesis C-methylase UbiE